jgi:hypothetical protein
MESLRQFADVHYREDCRKMTGHHENELFRECTFCKLNGLTLRDCVLSQSRFSTSNVTDALGFTLTLDCHSFEGVEYSPLLFDLLLVLMTKTRGNDAKRERLLDVIGRDRAAALLKVLKRTE